MEPLALVLVGHWQAFLQRLVVSPPAPGGWDPLPFLLLASAL